jgi:hypothetical protein
VAAVRPGTASCYAAGVPPPGWRPPLPSPVIAETVESVPTLSARPLLREPRLPVQRARALINRPLVAVGLPLVVGLIHAGLVASRYHVGSFDDDAAYLVMANGIVHGTGLTGQLSAGVPLVSSYPPGFAYVLAPLMALFGTGSFTPERLLSLVCFAAIFPLTWVLLRRRGFSPPLCMAVLGVLALDPVLATYATMVMAEMLFLVVLLVLLLVGERWIAQARTFTAAGVATVALAAATVWLKEAALAMIVGLVVWLVVRRRYRKAAFALAGTVALVLPIAIARIVTSTPLPGSRYASELGGYYRGGFVHRILVIVPTGVGKLFFDALPSAILPTDTPLNDHLATFVVFRGLACATVAVFFTVGLVAWIRRYRAEMAVFLVVAYLGEVVFYNFVIERRILLVLPVVTAWTVLGAVVSGRWVLGMVGLLRPEALARWRRGLVAAVVVVVAVPLLVQVRSDYLYRGGSSQPQGSPYMNLLARLGHPSDVVEAGYVWTTSLFTGHVSRYGAFTATAASCTDQAARSAIANDNAAFLYVGAIDLADSTAIDSPCLLMRAASAPWAVPLLHTDRDNTTVFELIGPGTGNPGLQNLLAAGALGRDTAGGGGQAAQGWRTVTAIAGVATTTWALPPNASVTQVSLGSAHAIGGSTGSVVVQLKTAGGAWRTVAGSPEAVGDGGAPALLDTLPPGTHASAVRVEVTSPTGAPVAVNDLAVLGTGS